MSFTCEDVCYGSSRGPSPALNTALLWRVMDHIRLNPAGWDQTHWMQQTKCGTTHCMAGWAVALSSGKVLTDDLDFEGMAAEALGLDEYPATQLFFWTHVKTEPKWYRIREARRHPTFAELVYRVAWVTGFRYNPDCPPGDPDDEGTPVPETEGPMARERELVCVS